MPALSFIFVYTIPALFTTSAQARTIEDAFCPAAEVSWTEPARVDGHEVFVVRCQYAQTAK